MKSSLNSFEVLACEKQATLFEQSIKEYESGSAYFVMRFMESDIAKTLDSFSEPNNFISLGEVIESLKEEFPSLNKHRGKKYSPKVMYWLGYLYRAWSILTDRSSAHIYRDHKFEELVPLYETYHTFSIEKCIERLEETHVKRPIELDYEVYKNIVTHGFHKK